MQVEEKQRTIDSNGRPVGEPVEKYDRRPSERRYRCEKCKSTNIDQFHVETTDHGKDSKGYTIRGMHDQEGWPCGGRCWPWSPPHVAKEAETIVGEAGDFVNENLGKIGSVLGEGFNKLFGKK